MSQGDTTLKSHSRISTIEDAVSLNRGLNDLGGGEAEMTRNFRHSGVSHQLLSAQTRHHISRNINAAIQSQSVTHLDILENSYLPDSWAKILHFLWQLKRVFIRIKPRENLYKMSFSHFNDTGIPHSKELSDQFMFIIEGILLGVVACFGIAGKLPG